MPNPARPNDELHLDLRVLEKRVSSSKPDRGILRLGIRLRNQRRETMLECIVTVLIARRQNVSANTDAAIK
jgi:acyl dehydratase